jgi:hypothetical protein
MPTGLTLYQLSKLSFELSSNSCCVPTSCCTGFFALLHKVYVRELEVDKKNRETCSFKRAMPPITRAEMSTTGQKEFLPFRMFIKIRLDPLRMV